MTEIYPFYDKPPQTYNDVYEYIITWLQPINSYSVIIHEGVSWKQIFGFKRGFNNHGVFTRLDNYAFHVEEDENIENFPNFGTYESFDKMIDGVVKRYCELWKIECL